MTKKRKLILGVVGALTLLAALSVGGVIWWILSNKDAWRKQDATVMAEGAAMGKQSTCAQCVAAAIQRLPGGLGAEYKITDQVRVKRFLKSCLPGVNYT